MQRHMMPWQCHPCTGHPDYTPLRCIKPHYYTALHHTALHSPPYAASRAAHHVTTFPLSCSVQNVMRGRTVLSIAHRLVTIQDADCICYIQPRDAAAVPGSDAAFSRILEQGTHEELMRSAVLPQGHEMVRVHEPPPPLCMLKRSSPRMEPAPQGGCRFATKNRRPKRIDWILHIILWGEGVECCCHKLIVLMVLLPCGNHTAASGCWCCCLILVVLLPHGNGAVALCQLCVAS